MKNWEYVLVNSLDDLFWCEGLYAYYDDGMKKIYDDDSCQYATFYNYFYSFLFYTKNVDTRRKTLRLLLPLPPPTRPSPTHPLPKTLTHPLTHPPFARDPHPPTLCPRYYY